MRNAAGGARSSEAAPFGLPAATVVGLSCGTERRDGRQPVRAAASLSRPASPRLASSGPAPSGRFRSAPLGPGSRPRADLAASEPAASAARLDVTGAPSPPLSLGGTGCAGPAPRPCPRSGPLPGGLQGPGTCARCRALSVPGDGWSVLAARQVSLAVWLERTKLRSFFPCRDGVGEERRALPCCNPASAAPAISRD